MHKLVSFSLLLCEAIAWGQTSTQAEPASRPVILQSREIDLAKAEIERVTELVKMGALPKIRLDEAEEKLADAQDEVILSRTLYGELPVRNLSDQMAEEMVAAAQRRTERQIQKISVMQKLVSDGVVAQISIQPLQDELISRRLNLSLAHARATLIGELAAIAKYEQSMLNQQVATRIEPYSDFTMRSMVHFEGSGLLLGDRDLKVLESTFHRHFERSLPISADGQTAVHNALGFDHHGRIDVALNPNEPAGVWLRKYLEAKGIPYYAFVRAIPGKATGAHIHIGPGSTRLHNAD